MTLIRITRVYAKTTLSAANPMDRSSCSRYADLDMIYRDTARFISDKKKVFTPKFGTDAPLFEHHTTSLVFNDPPLHTRVRKIMVGRDEPARFGVNGARFGHFGRQLTR